jgi:nitric oxide reductase subunit B
VPGRLLPTSITLRIFYLKGKAEYAIPKNTLTDKDKIRQLAAFYFWSSWAASTNRPNDSITYTSNWPHEPLIDNNPTSDAIIWTGFSIIMLLAGIGALIWYNASRKHDPIAEQIPSADPLMQFKPFPSQLAVIKYFWAVAGLFLLQMIRGVISAHYGVEGNGFYGIPIDKRLPYTVTRTWHTQLGIFWIATAWLAAGCLLGRSPAAKNILVQRLGVHVLFIALVTVVDGSQSAKWLSVKGFSRATIGSGGVNRF